MPALLATIGAAVTIASKLKVHLLEFRRQLFEVCHLCILQIPFVSFHPKQPLFERSHLPLYRHPKTPLVDKIYENIILLNS